MSRIALVGTGLIGRAWAISFARAGHEVLLFDEIDKLAEDAVAFAADMVPLLAREDLLGGQDPEKVLQRLEIVRALDRALDGVDHIQESTPEDLEVKRAVFDRLDRLASPGAVIASSTSAILPSRFTERLAGRHRCLVVHPINPPYLIPAVEIVPAPWTDSAIVERTRALMAAADQAPIVMKRELDGFVMNRMQGALLEEAFRLVADGYASVEDVDIGLRQGLALRWSFMGPFETIDLNAPGGIRDYVQRYQSIYSRLFPSMQRRVDWGGAVLETAESERRRLIGQEELPERQRWRDRRLMALAAHKRRADGDIGK